MRRLTYIVAATTLAVLASFKVAAQPKDAPPTLMLKVTKLLVSEDLHQPFGKEWFAKPGKWEVVDGVMRGVERSEDMHAAVRRREVRFTSAIVQFSFRLEGAKAMSLSMNAEKGHVCRVRVMETGFSVQRDKDKEKNEKPVVLDKCDVKIAVKEWHTMVVEMSGTDMVARLDGKHIAFGTHDGLLTPKASVGFTVQGSSVSFKNLRVYEGTMTIDWKVQRAKLLAERKK